MFIKRGDGQIASVIKEEELTDEQKQAVKKSLNQQEVKVDQNKKSENN